MNRYFTESVPSIEEYWRSIILFGKNTASYKFALAKCLLKLAEEGRNTVLLEELAEPYAMEIVEHLRIVDKQSTSPTSQFLSECRAYRDGSVSLDSLRDTTVTLGFANVIDAFHVVNQAPIQHRFFVDERRTGRRLVLSDTLLKLRDQFQFDNFPHEVESRWRLVETAWELNISSNLLTVQVDEHDNRLYVPSNAERRTDVTSCRSALNGYQKGRCFYCRTEISIDGMSPNLADVDHFFPWILQARVGSVQLNLNGVWNLVLSCQDCNRGQNGKSARIPSFEYLEKLHGRNNYLVDSHHPLRETIMQQTGNSEPERRRYLQEMDKLAISILATRWRPTNDH